MSDEAPILLGICALCGQVVIQGQKPPRMSRMVRRALWRPIRNPFARCPDHVPMTAEELEHFDRERERDDRGWLDG